ncbi:MAG: phosphomannomutase/phosphoglucomutase [Phycisphaeraceae bacterium]|nr:phosphomannomutase/phosphoglucomutase [Phycisphaeraceae bacterium]MCW5755236.1 phosphomannomutase/phosphoglucomutase [Phycisphaeraceae bacterium]
MLGRIFKAYDIRGTYPDLLTDNMAWQIGFGASKFLLGDAASAGETSPMMKNIVVGRDMRKSSPTLSKELIAGLNAQGGGVIDLGMVDTPFIYFAINHLDCAGGVMVTASHNPPQYNGFKISKRRAKPVGEATGLAEIRKFAAMAERSTVTPAGGRYEQRDLWDAYIRHVLSFLDLKGRKLKVAVDASNGMAGTTVPRVFGRKGAAVPGLEIIELNFDNSKGEFVHEPNPLVPANLAMLQEAVRKHKADVGICFDGDADRCIIVDENAEIVGCDHLTALLARWFLNKAPGSSIVYDLRSSKAVSEDIAAAGGIPVRGRVGHVFMKQLLAERKGVFGGELSGHFYFRDNFNADSGVIAMASVLTVLAHSGKQVSELIRPIARYRQSGEINFEIEDKEGAMAAMRGEYASRAESIDDLDGVTIDCFKREGWWCNIRKSNTEPLLRLNAEAKDDKILTRIIAEISPKLGKRVDH